MWRIPIRAFLSLVVLALSWSARAQTIPTPLQVTRAYGITAATQVFDNRSVARQCNVFTFNTTATTGPWSVQLEYSDVASTGPWTLYGSSAVLSAASSGASGIGNGYHNFVRLNTTAGTTTATLSCEKDFFLPSGGSGGGGNNVTFPITVQQGGTGATTPGGATQNLTVQIPDAGSVPRSLQSRASDLKSVFDFGAKGDCLTDDTASLQSALNSHQEVLWPRAPGGCYLTGTLTMLRGDVITGAGANDNGAFPSTHILLKNGSNASVIRTGAAAGIEPATSFYGVRNVMVDGNGTNQSSEISGSACLDFRDTLINSFLDHVYVGSCFGPSLYTGDTGGSVAINNVWIGAGTTSTYGWVVNPTVTGSNYSGQVSGTQVSVSNQASPVAGAFAVATPTVPTGWAHAIWINRVASVTGNSWRCEQVKTCVDISQSNSIALNGLSASKLGNPGDTDPTNNDLVRLLDTATQALTIENAFYDELGTNNQLAGTRVLGLSNGLTSNDWYQTPLGQATFPLYTHGNYVSSAAVGHVFLGESPVSANELDVRPAGATAQTQIKLFGSSPSDYSYLRKAGQVSTIGSTTNQSGEVDFLAIGSLGSSSDYVAVQNGKNFIHNGAGNLHSNIWSIDSTGAEHLANTPLLLDLPNAYYAVTNGSVIKGTGITMQATTGSGVPIRGHVGNNILWDGTSWDIGNDGGSEYADFLFTPSGGTCLSASNAITQPNRITFVQYLANVHTCITQDGRSIIGAALNALGVISNDTGQTLQVNGPGIVTGTLQVQNGLNYLTPTAQPTCDVNHRLWTWGIAAPSGPDLTQACLGNGSGGYAWVTNGSGGGTPSGTVTSVQVSIPAPFAAAGGPITTSGTIALTFQNGLTNYQLFSTNGSGVLGMNSLSTNYFPASGVTAGSYTNSNITVDATGRITTAANGTGGGGVSTATPPLAITGSNVSIPAANAAQNGYLSSADWATFNSKQGPLTFSGNTTKVLSTATAGTFTLNDGLKIDASGNVIDSGIPFNSGGGGGGGLLLGLSLPGIGTATSGMIPVVNSANQWTGQLLNGINSNGANGINIDGNGNAYLAPVVRRVNTTSDTITDSDCGNAVLYLSGSTVTVNVAAPGSLRGYCPVNISSEGGGQVNLQSSASFGGLGGPSTVTAALAAAGTQSAPHSLTIDNDGTYLHLRAASSGGGGGGGGTTNPSGGAVNSLQYNAGSSTFGGVINSTAASLFLTQASSGVPAFRALTAADLPAITFPTYALPLSLNNTTNVVSMAQSSASQSGFLASSDWATFNSKQSPLSFTGNTTKVATSTGTLVVNDCLRIDASGNLVDAGFSCQNSPQSLLGLALPGLGTATNGSVPIVVGGQWTPTVLNGINATGANGINVDPTGNAYLAPVPRKVTSTGDTVTDLDCGNAVIYTSAATVTANIAIPGSMRNYCPVTLISEGAGQINLASTARFGGATGPNSITGAIPSGGTVSQPRSGIVFNDGTYIHLYSQTTTVGTATSVNGIVYGGETVAFTTTPTFSTATRASRIVLSANISTFTLASGGEGQEKTLIFCQNGTGSFTVTPPANVHGFFLSGVTNLVASKCSAQHYTFSSNDAAWLADAAGIINQ